MELGPMWQCGPLQLVARSAQGILLGFERVALVVWAFYGRGPFVIGPASCWALGWCNIDSDHWWINITKSFDVYIVDKIICWLTNNNLSLNQLTASNFHLLTISIFIYIFGILLTFSFILQFLASNCLYFYIWNLCCYIRYFKFKLHKFNIAYDCLIETIIFIDI